MSTISIDDLQKENGYLKTEVDRLNGIITLLKRSQFGKKSERIENIEEQLLFNEIEKEAKTPVPPETETITYTRKKGRGKKKPFPDNLPREEKILDLKDEEKVCPNDGAILKEIGEEVTEKLKTVPARMWVVVERKKKYACPTCEGCHQPKTNSILPGTIATAELLSFIIFSKFFQGLPLYRLEELFEMHEIVLSRSTMARWLIKLKEKLIPIYNLLEEKAFESGYMAIDATHVQVLKEPGRDPETKSFMWARGSPEKGIVLFDYDPSGGGAVAKKLMTGFHGALQADAHRGYGALDENNLLLLGCMMHSRRRFHKAFIVGEEKPGLASDALAMFKWFYGREEEYKKMGLTPPQRKEWRDKELRPSLQTMKEWMEDKLRRVPKSSPVANAMNYFVKEHKELTAFLADGRYEVDNGWLERSIRKFAIGRNGWLFCDTVDGANASALLYSLSITAKQNGKDPFKAMTEILSKLPDASTADDYEHLAGLLLSPENSLSCHKKEG